MGVDLQEEVPIGEIKITNLPSVSMVINNLSSGIAVVMYDKLQCIGGMAHVLLPDSSLAGATDEMTPGRFADLAIPELVQQYLDKGAQKQDTLVRIVGGAQLFNFGGGGTNSLNIGTRNAIAIRTIISKHGLSIKKADVGGNKGRKIRFHVGSGILTITQAGQPDYEI